MCSFLGGAMGTRDWILDSVQGGVLGQRRQHKRQYAEFKLHTARLGSSTEPRPHLSGSPRPLTSWSLAESETRSPAL